jgi:hypothetical protein
MKVRGTSTGKSWLVSEENKGAELVCRHIAEGTTGNTVFVQCQFVNIGLALAVRVKDTGIANGGQIQQWNGWSVLQLLSFMPWFQCSATSSRWRQLLCLNCRVYFSLCCLLRKYTATLKVPINDNIFCLEFGCWERWPGEYNAPPADRIMHCQTCFAFQLSPLNF